MSKSIARKSPKITPTPTLSVVPEAAPAPSLSDKVASKTTNQLRTIETLAVDAREQLGIVLLDLFDREHATSGGPACCSRSTARSRT